MRRFLIALLLLGALCTGTAFGGHRASSRTAAAQTGPVDIGALAREDRQAKDSAATARPETAPAAGQNPWFTAMLFTGLILIAAAGTTVVVTVILRRAARTRPSPGLPAGEPAPAPEGTAGFALAEPARREPAGSAMDSPEEPEEDSLDERAAVLAQHMQRGRGEMDLALRLEARADETAGGALQRLSSGVTSNAQRVRTAKRFGVGRGEVDLAVRLKALASHAREKEPTP